MAVLGTRRLPKTLGARLWFFVFWLINIHMLFLKKFLFEDNYGFTCSYKKYRDDLCTLHTASPNSNVLQNDNATSQLAY